MTIREWLSRVGKARGYGIQSPWAYRFVTEVIGERLPYYGYADIEREGGSRRERRYRRLRLRVGNAVWPHGLGEADVARLTPDAIRAEARRLGTGGAILVTGIAATPEARRRWEEVKRHPDIGITFDLYRFAICFLDRSRYKQHYRLLF